MQGVRVVVVVCGQFHRLNKGRLCIEIVKWSAFTRYRPESVMVRSLANTWRAGGSAWRVVVQHWVRNWELGIGDNGDFVISACGEGARRGNDTMADGIPSGLVSAAFRDRTVAVDEMRRSELHRDELPKGKPAIVKGPRERSTRTHK